VLDGPGRELGARGEVEFGEGAGDVALHGALTDAEGAGDGAVRIYLRDELGDVALAFGEAAVRIPRNAISSRGGTRWNKRLQARNERFAKFLIRNPRRKVVCNFSR